MSGVLVARRSGGAPDAVLLQRYNSGVAAASAPINTWNVVQINTIDRDPYTLITSLSSGLFTLRANCWVEASHYCYPASGDYAALKMMKSNVLKFPLAGAGQVSFGAGELEGGFAHKLIAFFSTAEFYNPMGQPINVSGGFEIYTRVNIWRL